MLPAGLGKRRRDIVARDYAKSAVLIEIENTELRLAQPRAVLQHRLEYRLQFARRAGNDPQHLVRRCLPFQCFGKLAPCQRQFLYEVGIEYMRYRSPIARLHRSNCILRPLPDTEATYRIREDQVRACCTAGFLPGRPPVWVKTRQLPPAADITPR